MVSACEFQVFQRFRSSPRRQACVATRHSASVRQMSDVFGAARDRLVTLTGRDPSGFSTVMCVACLPRSDHHLRELRAVSFVVSAYRVQADGFVLLHLSRIVVGRCIIPCVRLLLGWVPDEVAVWYVWSGQTGRRKQGGKKKEKRVVFNQVWTSQCKLRDVWQL